MVLQTAQSLATLATLERGTPATFVGPFGPRQLIYADFTASGRSLPPIERALAEQVLPYYGNTHTEASFAGGATTRLREAARRAIRDGVNAGEDHAVIFCGSGSTSAINKLVAMLGLGVANDRGRAPSASHLPENDGPVVIVGPYEHHSNELPWRESLATVVRLPLDAFGRPCLKALDARLSEFATRPRRFVAISAASNVTGVITDIAAAATIAHQHGARIFADYAAGAPYLPINARGTGKNDHLDALYFSPHKFLGGPGASGVLVVNRDLHTCGRPTAPGGGTVSYVSTTRRRYVKDVEQLEEAGTPAILGDIRAGLVVQLKADIGTKTIHAAERRAVERATRRWTHVDGLDLLGPQDGNRLPIFSFNIRVGGRLLHHNFVVRLLNDLFGIQARGGCSCAGPYGHDLLGIDEEKSAAYQNLIELGQELYKPGWVRLGFHFTMDEATVDHIIDAVEFVSRRGKALLSLYEPDFNTGQWHTRGEDAAGDPWAGMCLWREHSTASAVPAGAPDWSECFARAETLADNVEKADAGPMTVFTDPGNLRWFWLPGE